MNTGTSTTTLLYVPLSPTIAQEARATLRDRFGHRLNIVQANAPCRLCLRIPEQPQNLILLSYQPLPDTGPYAEIGPIFIHADACDRYDDLEQFPGDFASRRLVLRAYSWDGTICDAVIADPGEAPSHATALFANEAVAEIHVRHESYTCFDFKIVRARE